MNTRNVLASNNQPTLRPWLWSIFGTGLRTWKVHVSCYGRVVSRGFLAGMLRGLNSENVERASKEKSSQVQLAVAGLISSVSVFF